MEILVILALVIISGVNGIDETTTAEKEFDETTTYSFVSTTENAWTTTTKTAASQTSSSTASTSTTSTPNPNEWSDLDEKESEILVKFVVGEIQKLKVEHKELDDCQELDLSSVLSGKKQVGKPTKYSVTLKVQPQMKETEECKHDNSTLVNMHPEICEADILEGDHGGTGSKTLLRSTCLQVEELQD